MTYDEIVEEIERLQRLRTSEGISEIEDSKDRCPICNYPLERNGDCRHCGYCERC